MFSKKSVTTNTTAIYQQFFNTLISVLRLPVLLSFQLWFEKKIVLSQLYSDDHTCSLIRPLIIKTKHFKQTFQKCMFWDVSFLDLNLWTYWFIFSYFKNNIGKCFVITMIPKLFVDKTIIIVLCLWFVYFKNCINVQVLYHYIFWA